MTLQITLKCFARFARKWTPALMIGRAKQNHKQSFLNFQEIDGKSFLLLTREALIKFKGVRLGQAYEFKSGG